MIAKPLVFVSSTSQLDEERRRLRDEPSEARVRPRWTTSAVDGRDEYQPRGGCLICRSGCQVMDDPR